MADALAHQIIPVVEALESYGADVERALSLAGLSRADLADPSTRLDGAVERRMWDASVEVTGDRQIALRLAPLIRHGTLGAYEYLLRNAGTLQEMVQWADRYMRIVDTQARIGVRAEGPLAIARVWREGGGSFVPEGIECLFAVIGQCAREDLPEDVSLSWVAFEHEAIGPTATYEETFRCAVRFGALANEFAMPVAALASRMRDADPGLGRVLHDHVQTLLPPATDSFVERARQALLEHIDRGETGVDAIAKVLHVSARTLRRRLDAAGTSYSVLLDDVRRERAAFHVGRTDAPLAEVATRLGYTDPSAFYRAFKRWTSLTPAQYRKRESG